MSRGLGVAEWFVLEELAKTGLHTRYLCQRYYSEQLRELAGLWAHRKGTCGCPDYECEANPSERESIRRAAKSLERQRLTDSAYSPVLDIDHPGMWVILTETGARELMRRYGEVEGIDYEALSRTAYPPDDMGTVDQLLAPRG
jgi:hypothetical protein